LDIYVKWDIYHKLQQQNTIQKILMEDREQKKKNTKAKAMYIFRTLAIFLFLSFSPSPKKVAPIVFEQFFNGIYLCQF
jgi:hypothetical protein